MYSQHHSVTGKRSKIVSCSGRETHIELQYISMIIASVKHSCMINVYCQCWYQHTWHIRHWPGKDIKMGFDSVCFCLPSICSVKLVITPSSPSVFWFEMRHGLPTFPLRPETHTGSWQIVNTTFRWNCVFVRMKKEIMFSSLVTTRREFLGSERVKQAGQQRSYEGSSQGRQMQTVP